MTFQDTTRSGHGSTRRSGHRRAAVLPATLAVATVAVLSTPVDLVGQESDAATDTVPPTDTTTAETWEDIGPHTVAAARVDVPLRGDVAGPSVLAVQILLDRAEFSPGVLDGRWGRNTEMAVYWYQERYGLDATGEVDETTLSHLRETAGGDLVHRRTLTAEDVEGPFVELPEDIYERAEMSCTCYESLTEQLGERFHVTPATLRRLNPEVHLNDLDEGDVLLVPNVRHDGEPEGAPVAEIVISDRGHWLHARAADGTLLYHFPAVLGADFAPSPDGEFSVTSITHDPVWHYKPDLLTGVDPSRPDAVIPAGPNNAVGVVWMQLSRDHYGIHGTSAPSTVGYADSHGCVRLTNWDVTFLAERLETGVPVRFVETDRRTGRP